MNPKMTGVHHNPIAVVARGELQQRVLECRKNGRKAFNCSFESYD